MRRPLRHSVQRDYGFERHGQGKRLCERFWKNRPADVLLRAALVGCVPRSGDPHINNILCRSVFGVSSDSGRQAVPGACRHASGTLMSAALFAVLFSSLLILFFVCQSNVLDSICFVLGITNLAQVRVSRLEELVFKCGQV